MDKHGRSARGGRAGRRRIRDGLAALLLLGLAGCDDVSIVEDQSTGLFSPEEYAHDAVRGDIPVAVLGSADGVGGERLARLVLEHMQGADWEPHARFTTVGEPTGSRIYSYVLMFNGPLDVTSATLCARPLHLPPTESRGVAGKLRVVAGLCRDGQVATGVTGRAENVGGVGDERFHRLIVGVMQALTRPNQQRIDR